jgi:hypothetical protein
MTLGPDDFLQGALVTLLVAVVLQVVLGVTIRTQGWDLASRWLQLAATIFAFFIAISSTAALIGLTDGWVFGSTPIPGWIVASVGMAMALLGAVGITTLAVVGRPPSGTSPNPGVRIRVATVLFLVVGLGLIVVSLVISK